MVGTAFAVPTVSVSSSTKALTVTGGSEDSNINVSYSAGTFTVENPGSTLAVSGTSCILVATDKATCFYGGVIPASFAISLGTGNDSASIAASVPSTITAVIKGVGQASSAGAPLDVTTDADSVWPSITGSPNSDRISVESPTSCQASVDGGAGDDEIYIDVQNLDLDGELGCLFQFSSVTGGDGDDLLDASTSKVDMTYEASEGHDVFVGGSGNDHITVGDGPDWAFGGGGNDRFYDNGGPDPSKLWGGPGSDVFTDWDGSEADITFFDGGSGTDIVAYHNVNGSHNVNLSLDGAVNDGVSGEMDNIKTSVEVVGDTVYNTTGQYTGNDVISGSNGPNNIGGYNGNDTLDGLAGVDIMKGGAGNDAVTGGAGPDKLYGDDNNDEIFAEDGEIDTISCGSGTDIAHADSGDTVDADCETVL